MDAAEWRPSASSHNLKKYARMLQDIRAYFLKQNVLEVSVPCIASSTSPATHLDSIRVEDPLFRDLAGGSEQTYFLQTSPEFFMKRLLSSGSGPIYRMGPSFRRGELSSRHNPEFTMLEWYRPGWDFHRLIGEVEGLVIAILGEMEFERMSYRELFSEYVGFDPHNASVNQLAQFARQKLGYQPREPDKVSPEPDNASVVEQTKDEWLELIFSGYVLPRTTHRSLVIVEFPAGQAELSEIALDNLGEVVAHRFELYVNGVELANGYQELTDPGELQRRFDLWNEQRQRLGKQVVRPDIRLIEAQKSGLPRCSGVALGVDRLAMCLLGSPEISDALTFPIDRA